MAKSESIKEIALALSKAQGEFDHAKKDVKNEFFKSKYADLASVIDAAKLQLSANGLAVSQIIDYDESGMYLETTLMHSSGEWITGRYPIRPVKPDPQSVGSATTYARRYAFSAITCIAADDDDGNAASQVADKSKANTQSRPQPNASNSPANDDAIINWLAALDEATSQESLDRIWSTIPNELSRDKSLKTKACSIANKFKQAA